VKDTDEDTNDNNIDIITRRDDDVVGMAIMMDGDMIS